MLLAWSDLHQRSAFFTEGFDLVCNVMIGLCGGRVGIKEGEWLSRIARCNDIGVQRDSPQNWPPHIGGRGFAAALSKHFHFLVTVRAFQSANVFNDSDNGHFAV